MLETRMEYLIVDTSLFQFTVQRVMIIINITVHAYHQWEHIYCYLD